ncbi:hypothetical protein PG988_001720 [Apiospora saccharicola]
MNPSWADHQLLSPTSSHGLDDGQMGNTLPTTASSRSGSIKSGDGQSRRESTEWISNEWSNEYSNEYITDWNQWNPGWHDYDWSNCLEFGAEWPDGQFDSHSIGAALNSMDIASGVPTHEISTEPSTGHRVDITDISNTETGGMDNRITIEISSASSVSADSPHIRPVSPDSVILEGLSPESPDLVSISPQPTVQGLKQIGIGRIHFEFLALDRNCRFHSEQSDNLGLSEVNPGSSHSMPVDSEGDHRDSDESGEGQSGGNHGISEPLSSIRPETTNRAAKRKRTDGIEADEDIDDDEAQKRPRRKMKASNSHQNGTRLACPYQVYDKSQVCFNPSAQNPLGGCAGIGRLRSFDTTQQKTDHETQPLCDARESPPAGALMSLAQEGDFERLRMSGPEDTSWWRMFQLLIPGMNERDIASLKVEFSPYYIKFDSFMVPAITFTNVSLPPLQAPELAGSSHFTNNQPLQQDFDFVDWSQVLNAGLPNISPGVSHTLDVPVFATSATISPSIYHSPLAAQTLTTPNLSVVMSSGSGGSMSSSASSAPPQNNASYSNCSQSAETVPRRNYDRLLDRYTASQRVNSDLRETARQVQSSLSRVDVALEEVLSLAGLPEGIYERIVEISNIVAPLKERS